MAAHGLRDQDRLEGASNYVISKAQISCPLDEYHPNIFMTSMVAIHAHLEPVNKYRANMENSKRPLPDWVKDHIRDNKAYVEALASLYEGSFEQRKMYLE